MTALHAGTSLAGPPAALGTRTPAERSLGSYLLLPRPKDLGKAVILPVAFAVGTAARGGVSTTALWQAGVVWAVLELLVYQARYQWNDVRGFAADQAHPEKVARGRLPGPVERGRPHVAASLLVAALRLVGTAAVAVALPDVRDLVLVMTVGVFAAAAVYEYVRSRATRHTSAVPVPLRPSLLAVWVVVGAGYAVRGMTGLALAAPLDGRPALAVSATVTMWALGIVFVTCRWVLEAMCFASFDGGRVTWSRQVSQGRDHTLGLVRWAGSEVAADGPAVTQGPGHWRALRDRTPLTAPWHVAVLVAGASAAVAGRLLTGASTPLTCLLVGVAGLVAALAVTRLARYRGPAALALALGVAMGQAVAGLERPEVAVLPLLLVLGAYSLFTDQCAADIGRPLRRLESMRRR